MPVEYYDEVEPGQGIFLLLQGLQRRVAVTISAETGTPFQWTHVREMTIGLAPPRLCHNHGSGRIRPQPPHV